MQDGNIHCHVDNLSRRKGQHGARIAVASAAYISGQKIWSEIEQRWVEFSMREDVVFSEILLPEGAPEWCADRTELWNRVDLLTKRKDGRLAKTVTATIARDIPAKMRPELLREFASEFLELGCVADVAIHEDGTDHNPHVHILLTTRQLNADGFGSKLDEVELRSFVKRTRKRWSELTNQYLEKSGSALRVDHRSYKARGIEAVPTVHRGPHELERREKREHARRAREEKNMPGPDAHDRLQYPNLAARETWPPEREASPDMSPQEQDEHQRYWDNQKVDRLEERYNSEPDKPWYQQARDNARTQTGRSEAAREEPSVPEAEPEIHPVRMHLPSQDDNRQQASYAASVFNRARAMEPSQAEIDARNAVRTAPEATRQYVEDFIFQERMQTIREQDRAENLRRLPEHVRSSLEALRQPSREREHEHPEQGPNGELVSRQELEEAHDRMIEDYERDEPDMPERDR